MTAAMDPAGLKQMAALQNFFSGKTCSALPCTSIPFALLTSAYHPPEQCLLGQYPDCAIGFTKYRKT